VSDVIERSKRSRNAVMAMFFVAGIALSTWIARLPALRDNLDIDTLQVGIFLFGGGAGSLLGLSVAASIVSRLGERLTITLFGILAILGMGLVGILSVTLPLFIVGFGAVFIFGLGMSVLDVAMNLEGARVERGLNTQIMPLLHAMFSIGALIGALIAAGASAVNLGVNWHFGAMATLLVPITVWVTKAIPDNDDYQVTPGSTRPSMRRELLSVWREPRTLAIGVIALAMAFAEGSATDWLALGMVDDRGASNASAAVWFVLFSLAMAVGRIGGVTLLNRFGRLRVLAGAAMSAVAGIALLVLVDSTWAAVVAVVLWGLGSSLGFPVAMSAAADEPAKGPARVSVVATIAYGAFLVGPPMLGALGQAFGILTSLWAVVAVILLSFFAIPQAQKPGA
jgi:fucose permease